MTQGALLLPYGRMKVEPSFSRSVTFGQDSTTSVDANGERATAAVSHPVDVAFLGRRLGLTELV